MSEYIYQSAYDLARLIRQGRATSLAIVQEHLDQINKHNPQINAVVILTEEEALATAAERDREAKAGRFRGPLHGVPITIKEQYWIKGLKSTINTNRLKDWVAPEDALIVRRIKEAGAVILGKTNVSRDLLDYQVSGDIYPDAVNPYHVDYSPGGSSGGSAAALATGMTPLELGGDFGGSVRVPANYCGLYGLKPTEQTVPGHGNAPLPEGATGAIFHMAQAGPLARTLDDLETLWRVIVGPDPGDRRTPRIEWREPTGRALAGYKIAWVDGWPGYETSRQTAAAIRGLVEQIAAQGAAVANAAPADQLHDRSLALFQRLAPQLIAQDVPRFFRPIMKRQMLNGLLKGQTKYRQEFNQGFKISFRNYAQTMGLRARIIAQWERFLAEYDFLICPISYGPAYKRCPLGSPITYDGRELAYINYVWPYVACFNASGHPAMNLPLGLGEEGLPLGVQIVGPYWSEPELLHFARLVSQLTAGFVKPAGF